MKYNLEIARKELLDYGYYLDANEYINNQTKMPCHDEDGFKYLISIDDYRTNRHPYKYVKSNPYTLENIQMVLDRETDGVIVLEKQYINSTTKMKFRCSCGEVFTMSGSSFVSGKRYCNYCAKSKRYDGLIDYQKIVEDACCNRGYTLLSKNITRSNQEFEYICNIHEAEGVQTSSYDRMINCKRGCKYCGIVSRGIKHRVDIDKAIKLTEEKGFKFIDWFYSKQSSNSSSKLKINCVCNKHPDKGIQTIDYQNMKNNKTGCIYCNGQGRTKESFQDELNAHSRNIDIIEFNSYQDVTVKCRLCGNIWKTNGIYLTSGHGCPNCYRSSYEKIISKIFDDNNIVYISQYKINDCRDISPLPFDFYLCDYNTLIEVDGQGHYYPVNFRGISDEDAEETFNITKRHDDIKSEYCENNGIRLLRIPYFIIDDKNIDTEKYVLNRI